MRFIICGTILHPEVELVLPGASPAAGKYLRNLEKALRMQGHEVIYMSYVALSGAKEAYNKLNIDDNGIVYKDKTIFLSVIDYQKKVLESLRQDDVVIFYNIVYFELGLIDKIRRRGNKALLILADHTDSFKENGSLVRFLLAKRISFEFRKFRYGIALSERAKRFFSHKASVIIMEGGIDLDCFTGIMPPVRESTTKFMYAGTLSEVTGVDILLDAIKEFDDDRAEFIISGKGGLEQSVVDAAKEDKRIKYLGFIPDKDYYQILNEIDVFINPRNMNLEQNQNNFPSKVLEYLATGRCVISTKFPGWDKFTDNFMFYDNSKAELVGAMQRVVEKDEKAMMDIFSKNKKKAEVYSWNKQAARIVAYLGNKEDIQ